MANKKVIGIKIDRDLALELKIYCLKNNITMSKVIEELIKEFLAKNSTNK
jgi:antitoxin component of RelBE/YafQ-DinJ toxin-antitoxin module